MTKKFQYILDQLPYKAPFRFIDHLTHVDEEGASGTFTFSETLDFYQGHFVNHPVTPGVILTECMAQIGVVCLGLFLAASEKLSDTATVALSETNIVFHKAVFPGEKVFVASEKVYFRFGKLKCKVRMKNTKEEVVCQGTISGMLIQPDL
ncbi:3-hydroxyacyl-ACP dehydratase FabZ family protein [Altibacter sp. HG106]|uniref:3-hydroxyacyl-ACP dehydratase FabZ family protein n=1 Tax=Altibacter sp. HG106 TaxID=3023937 RepID=UPI00235101E1|nr:3-hydroxyacyl-ACP dehydratase FabZ family protein [Altibacter sp. HG106]MDC7993521.1 beta-hydroxyacyl-ACP dehydratase [Altibacter sp. HG106]